MKLIGSYVKEQAGRPRLAQRRLLQHAARCSYILLNGLVTEDGMAWVCYDLGILYHTQGKLTQAEQMYQAALKGFEKALGPDHTPTLDVVNYLGFIYMLQGKVTEAEQIFQRVMKGYKKAFGLEHTSIIDMFNALGSLYLTQRKLTQADSLCQRALKGYEKIPGHTSIFNPAHNLSVLYSTQGKLMQAESMGQRALKGYEKAFGPEHKVTHTMMNNLGLDYMRQEEFTKAEQMYQRPKGYEKIFEPEHPLTFGTTLETVIHLGYLYAMQEKQAQAESMFHRVLKEYEKTLGFEHTSTFI